jgi:integrase
MDDPRVQDTAALTVAPPPPALALALPQRPTAAQGYIAGLTSERSRQTMIWGLRTVARALGLEPDRWASLPWHLIDAAELGAAQTRLAAVLAPTSVNLAMAAVRGVLRAAWRQGYLDEDKHRRLTDLKPVRGSRVSKGIFLTLKEQQKLLAAAAASPGLCGPRNVALLAVALGCGLRRSELVRLPVEAFEPEAFGGQGGLVVRGKGNREDRLPLPPGALGALQRWLGTRGGEPGPLFPVAEPQGRGWVQRSLNDTYFAELLEALARKAGVRSVHPHDLRRTYATSLFVAGHDARTVQRLMRHAKIETTARYDLRGDEELARAAATLTIPV